MSSAQPQETQRRRKGRKVPTDTNTADDSAHTDEGSVRARNKSHNKKKNESTLTQALNTADGSITPPKSSDGQAHEENGQKNTRRGKKPGNQGNNHHGTPGPKHHRQHNGTPKQVAMDAYAGPTFHASPAPSALPIPKMFSRSAPAAEKDVGIVARLAQEEGNTSSGSDGSPDSPSSRPSTRVTSGGPAMFDFLLNADRQEKARQLQSQTLSPPQGNGRGNSVSPVNKQASHRPQHSRTLTDSSLNLAGPGHSVPQQSQSPANTRQIPPFAPTPPYTNAPPHYQLPNDGNLQRMLFSSPPQGPPPNGIYGTPEQYQWNSSPASAPSASPYGSPASSTGLAASSRPAPVSPYTQASPSPSARRSGYAQYGNSGLRRELASGGLNHTPPSLGNLPRYDGGYAGRSPLASPMQQRFSNNNSPFAGQGHHSPNRNPSPTSNKRFSAQDALKSLGGASQTSEMEERLRQILKIDQLRPQGTQSPNAMAVPS